MKAQQSQNNHGDTMAAAPALTVTSSAFQNGSAIPQRFSCQGDNISPALAWSGAPEKTKSFALVCEDPDAPHGTFIHWVIYNIPPADRGLAENIPTTDTLPNGTRQGKNGANKTGFLGPCPPAGSAHRYYFKLYALDEVLSLSGSVTRDTLISATQSHVLADGQIMGTYQRK